MKKVWKRLLQGAGAVAALVGLYVLAMLAGALIALNADFRSAPDGVRIWVSCSDIHSDVVVPVKNGVFDWTSLLDRDQARAVDGDFAYLALGWGDRRFFLETPTWSDVKVANVVSAFCGLNETAMHVNWLKDEPAEGALCRSLVLTPAQYAELCAFVSESFAKDGEGRSRHIDAPGYTATDAFYEAHGRYSALKTCNTWTGQALAAGGIRVGLWTPMKWGVLWQLGEVGQAVQ
jgi:uncharacterized protein (TIGR02117 family)